jgi:hypothetical protein
VNLIKEEIQHHNGNPLPLLLTPKIKLYRKSPQTCYFSQKRLQLYQESEVHGVEFLKNNKCRKSHTSCKASLSLSVSHPIEEAKRKKTAIKP